MGSKTPKLTNKQEKGNILIQSYGSLCGRVRAIGSVVKVFPPYAFGIAYQFKIKNASGPHLYCRYKC